MDTTPPAAPPGGSTPPPLPPPFGAPRPRQLRRRPDKGPIAGVCAGVAEYFNVDPVIVRIAMVVLAFSGPGVIAYVLAWIFVPATTRSTGDPFARPAADRRDRGAQVFGIVLLAVSVSILWGGWWSPARRWMFPLALMALGAWLLLRRDDAAALADPDPGVTDVRLSSDAPDGPAAPAQPARDATLEATLDATRDATREAAVPTADAAGGGHLAPPWDTQASVLGAPPPPPDAITTARGRRRIVAPMVMGALLLWTGIAFLGDVSLESGLAIALCILGLGFVLGSFVGGSRALIVPAVLVGAALIASSVVDIPLSGPMGQRTWAPQTIAEVDDHYELSLGEGRLNLTALAFERGDRLEIEASVGLGHLVVEVPDGVTVSVAAQVSAGDAALFGRSQSGIDVVAERVQRSTGDVGTIVLRLEVGLGQIEVVAEGSNGARLTPGTTSTLG